MECYDCGVKVEPKSHPEGECPLCKKTYTLPMSAWDWYECPDCGNKLTSQWCHDCGNWFGEEQ